MDEQMTWSPKSSNDILEHHGIKGQRWGVRRTPEQLGHKIGGKRKWRIRMKTSAERKEEQYQRKKAKLDAKDQALKRKEELRRQEDDLRRRRQALKEDKITPKTTDVPKKKNVKDLSDDELRQIISRYNMEQQYAKISKEQATKGKKWVVQMLEEAGKDVAKQYTKKMMTAMIDAAIEKMKRRRRDDSQGGNNSGGSSGSGSGSS